MNLEEFRGGLKKAMERVGATPKIEVTGKIRLALDFDEYEVDCVCPIEFLHIAEKGKFLHWQNAAPALGINVPLMDRITNAADNLSLNDGETQRIRGWLFQVLSLEGSFWNRRHCS